MMPLRILSLLLCLLIAGPMSAAAHTDARPEARVGKTFSGYLKQGSVLGIDYSMVSRQFQPHGP